MSNPNEKKLIDIDRILKEKNPFLAKWLPRFVKSYIKRTIHEDELNDAHSRYKHLRGNDFANAAYEEFSPKIIVEGIEHIPKTGGCIVASNHPLGGLDGITLMKVVGDHRKDIRFLVNDLLMHLQNFDEIFVPVNKLGRNPQEYITKIEETYKSDFCILIFPAGLVSRRQENNKIEDLVWKKSFINKSVQYKKDVIPVFIEAANSKFFYNLAYYRKKLGINANIEMFFLVDEMYKQRGKTLRFVFGKPIPYSTFDTSKTDNEWAELVKQHVYAMGNGKELIFK